MIIIIIYFQIRVGSKDEAFQCAIQFQLLGIELQRGGIVS